MDITINVKETISEIRKERKSYEKAYDKNVKLFHKKLKEYHKYVGKCIKSNSTSSLKYPPQCPKNEVTEFIDSVEILNAHQGKSLVMTDDEYGNLKSVIHASNHKMFNDTVSLNSLSY